MSLFFLIWDSEDGSIKLPSSGMLRRAIDKKCYLVQEVYTPYYLHFHAISVATHSANGGTFSFQLIIKS